jgi:hypothetical protein
LHHCNMERHCGASSYFVQCSNGRPEPDQFPSGQPIAQASNGAAKSGKCLNLARSSAFVDRTLL